MFGTSLCKSIRYAKVSLGYVDETSVKHPEVGTIPIVVAQCGSFLKAKGIISLMMVVCSTHCSSIKVYLNPTSFYCQVTSGTWIHYKAFSMTHANRMDCIWTGTLEITVYTMQPPYWKDTLTSYRKR